MTYQISGPCCDSDIEPDPYKSFIRGNHVCQQSYVLFEGFYRQKKQNPALFQ